MVLPKALAMFLWGREGTERQPHLSAHLAPDTHQLPQPIVQHARLKPQALVMCCLLVRACIWGSEVVALLSKFVRVANPTMIVLCMTADSTQLKVYYDL